jgi:hypothetical protein
MWPTSLSHAPVTTHRISRHDLPLLPLAWLGGRKMGADTGLHLFAKKWVRRKSLNQFNMAVIAGAAK